MKFVCPNCEIEMRPLKNDIRVVETFDAGKPYRLWCADLWSCRKCGNEIVTGFGKAPVAEWFSPGFLELIEKEKEMGTKVVYSRDQ